MFGFDTPLGRAIYTLKVPGVSTSAAGRIAVIFSLSLAVLAGIVISNLDKINYKKILFTIGLMGLFLCRNLLSCSFSMMESTQRIRMQASP